MGKKLIAAVIALSCLPSHLHDLNLVLVLLLLLFCVLQQGLALQQKLASNS
jgi:hypothetical protein